MSKITFLFIPVYVAVIFASEVENEKTNHICTYNITITEYQVDSVKKVEATQKKTCEKWDTWKWFCKKKIRYRIIAINETLRVPKQQAVLSCCKGYVNESGVCTKECKYGYYGKGCAQKCTCSETELCNKEDGSCHLADVCIADYAKNCIANTSVLKCESLRDSCNDTELLNIGGVPIRIVKDLCCKDTNNNYSLCLSNGNCICDEISTDRNCKPSQSKNRYQTSVRSLDQKDDSAVFPVAIATPLVVIITLGGLIIVIFKIRRRRQTKSKLESTVTFTSLENTPSQSELRQINTDGDGDQDVNLHDTNINDQVDQYENDVIQAVAPSNYVDGTNYEELQQNCTEHTYLNVQVCHIYDHLVLTEENK